MMVVNKVERYLLLSDFQDCLLNVLAVERLPVCGELEELSGVLGKL